MNVLALLPLQATAWVNNPTMVIKGKQKFRAEGGFFWHSRYMYTVYRDAIIYIACAQMI